MPDSDVLARGIELYNRQDYAGALSFFLALPPDSGAEGGDIAYFLGLCYARLGRFEDSLLYLEQVVTAGGEQGRVQQCRFLLAVIYALSGRRRLAAFELNKLLEAGYREASVYAAIAYLSWEQNDVEKSLEYYEKSLSADPENATALNGIGYVLACEDRDLAKALSFCKRAVEYSPDSAACLDSLGWVYYKLGLLADARKYLEQAAVLDRNNEKIAEHIRAVLSAEGKK
ncbi:MAG: tetratricopeptide repeat protein [Treponemataceae bacterium]|nr:tetratricopeptide repeat protein [Treponemataceae bacterium]